MWFLRPILSIWKPIHPPPSPKPKLENYESEDHSLQYYRIKNRQKFHFIDTLNVINKKKRVLKTECNNLAEASISPHFTTTCDFDKYMYTIIITFWRETSPKSLPSGNRGPSPNITCRCFLKTHYNHKLKIDTTDCKTFLPSKTIKFFWQTGLGIGGLGYWGNFPVWIEVQCMPWF